MLDRTDVEATILCLNRGSSSLKYGVFRARAGHEIAEDDEIAGGGVDVGADGSQAAAAMQRDLADRKIVPNAIGHRVVFGGPHHAPERITEALTGELRSLIPLSPIHLPIALDTIRDAQAAYPGVPQVACFDTAFHADMPDIAKRLPVRRDLWAKGIRRFGYHGLSYEYIVWKLGACVRGRVIVAHLGNGASMAALRDGAPVDTTMGLTPLAGLMMGTRPGDLDPGLITYLLREGFDLEALSKLLERESGLLGVSGTTADVRTLLEAREHDARAAEALDLFVYIARKQLGGMAAALGGLDRLVFTGGIGEHAAPIREQIVAGLDYLRPFDVDVVPTNENLVVARRTRATAFG